MTYDCDVCLLFITAPLSLFQLLLIRLESPLAKASGQRVSLDIVTMQHYSAPQQ